MGRPSKLDARVRENIRQALIDGATYEQACRAQRITYQTFLNWMDRGERDGKGDYFEFFEAIKQAEALAVTEALSDLRMAGSRGQWQARAWLLERRYPELYSRAATEVPALLQAILDKLPDDETRAAVLRAAGVMGPTYHHASLPSISDGPD